MIIHDRNSGAKLAVTEDMAKAREAVGAAFAKALTPEILDRIGAFITPKKETPEERAERLTKGKDARTMLALTIPMPGLTIKFADGQTLTTEAFTINANAPLPTKERETVAKVGSSTGAPATMEALTLLMRGRK